MAFRQSLKFNLKWLTAAVLGVGLAGCASNTPEQTSFKVLSPAGAPALATLGLKEDAKTQIDYVEGQDVLVSELAKKDGEYDLIIAPVNVGVKIWSSAQAYQLDGIVTWGNLYMVGENTDWNNEENTIALFGENAVPGMVFDNLYPEVKARKEYYPSVAEASQALLAGKANSALLAQPVAAGTIAKGKENGKNLQIAADLQSEWQAAHDTKQKGYPQAALFVRKGVNASKAEEQIKSFIEKASDPAVLEKAIEETGAKTLGVPSAQLAAKTWPAQNIHFEKAADVESDLKAFLDVFGIQIPEGLIVK